MRFAIVLYITVWVLVGCSSSKEVQQSSVNNSNELTSEIKNDSSLSDEPTPPKQKVHIVKSGESLSLIAKQYDISLEELVKLNNIKNPDMIRVGQEIKIPVKNDVVEESGDSL